MNMITCPRCWGSRNRRCDKCDDRGSVYDTRLSKDFTLGELTYSPKARALSINNDPTIRQVDRLRELAVNLLQPMRDSLGLLEVTSGFRTPELNRAIKGSKTSAHMEGYAADLHPEHVLLEDVMHWFKHTDVPFDQAILEYGRREDDADDDWVHAGWKNAAGQQRRQLLVMRGGVYTPWVG